MTRIVIIGLILFGLAGIVTIVLLHRYLPVSDSLDNTLPRAENIAPEQKEEVADPETETIVYQYVDENGVTHFTNIRSTVPEKQRDSAQQVRIKKIDRIGNSEKLEEELNNATESSRRIIRSSQEQIREEQANRDRHHERYRAYQESAKERERSRNDRRNADNGNNSSVKQDLNAIMQKMKNGTLTGDDLIDYMDPVNQHKALEKAIGEDIPIE